jgi:hypothetical protein
MGGCDYEPRSPKHSDFCSSNGLLNLLFAKNDSVEVPQEKSAYQAISRACVNESKIEFGEKCKRKRRRSKSTNDLLSITTEKQIPVSCSEIHMQNSEFEFHMVEDDDLDSIFFDPTEPRMADRQFENHYRSTYNFQVGLILCKEVLQMNHNDALLLPCI